MHLEKHYIMTNEHVRCVYKTCLMCITIGELKEVFMRHTRCGSRFSSLLQNFWPGYHSTWCIHPPSKPYFGPIFQILISNLTWFPVVNIVFTMILQTYIEVNKSNISICCKTWPSIIYIPSDRINYLDIWNMKWSFNRENTTCMPFPLLNVFLNLKWQ